jgi:electron transfer flavoprotein beta subunit
MVFFYTAGMFLNDLCDHAIDCHELPERPLPSGLVSRAEAVAAVAAGCDFIVAQGIEAGGHVRGQIGLLPLLAELLDAAGAVPVQKIEARDGGLYVERVTEDGYQPIDMPLPSVLGISNEINQPRYPTLKGIMASGKVAIPVWTAADLGLAPDQVGASANRIVLERLYVPVRESKCEFIEADTPQEMGEKLAQRLREARLI